MTDTQNDNETEGVEAARTHAASARASGHSVYVYGSAGIAEREGHVPLWLWLVVASLLVWGIYYLVTYWNAPLTQT